MLHCKNSELEGWMRDHGVIIVDPKNSKLVKFIDAHPDKLTGLGISTWFRIAIPTVIDELLASKHERLTTLFDESPVFLEYALYTDADIVFVKNVTFDRPMLPMYLSMPIQGDHWCCSDNPYSGKIHTNAGVILMNVTSFREIEEEFTTYVLKNIMKNNPKSHNFNDQTAFHEFFPIHIKDLTLYQKLHMRLYHSTYYKLLDSHYYSDTLPKEYEWEPYLRYNPSAVIIHWHGPKVNVEACAQVHPPAVPTNTTKKSSVVSNNSSRNGEGSTELNRSLLSSPYQTVLKQLIMQNKTAPHGAMFSSVTEPKIIINAAAAAHVYPPMYDWFTPLKLSAKDLAFEWKNGKRHLPSVQTLTKNSLDGYHYATSLYFSYVNIICTPRGTNNTTTYIF